MNSILKYILLLIIILTSLSTTAQEIKRPQNLVRYDFKRIHFGFTLGINQLNFNIKKDASILENDTLASILPISQNGFNLGIVSNLRIGRYTDLRFIPTLVFGERHLNYSFNNNGIYTQKIKNRIYYD